MPTDDAAPHMSALRAPARPPRAQTARRLKLAGLLALCLAAAVIAIGLLNRGRSASRLGAWTSAESIPAVSVIMPTTTSINQHLVLPGDLQAYYNAQIYPRVSGYVHAWYADIGAHVKAGQVLATIDTPELDQQLIQVRADLQSAQANMSLAKSTARRWSTLLAQDAVSKQESDEKAGDLAVKTALVGAAKANVDRLIALKGFARIVAPFDGVVTARKTDIGALVNAGAGSSSSSELFDVAKVDKLRLYVRVPQNDSANIRPGMVAKLTVPEHPGREFAATLTSTANAVTDKSGTLLVELAVDNALGALQAGDYAEVSFVLTTSDVGAQGAVVQAPSSAILFRKSGMEAAVVDSSRHVHLHRLAIGRDLGQTVEVTSGLAPTDRVIDNPPDSIAEGQLVRVIDADAKPASDR